jgi:hypothetical protein
VIFFLILILGAFLRFFLINEIPLGLYPDEAMNGNNELEALRTGNFKIFYPENNGREGLFLNIQALSILAFGNTPWALRIVSAFFGTLTILGVYLLSQELFRRNGREQNLFDARLPDSHGWRGRLTQWIENINVYPETTIPLLAAFLIASSYWHINFSRIGFRAIAVPFFSSFALYFLLKGLRRGKILDLAAGGIFMGLGFHTYIAFRFMPFVAAVPMGWYLWKWWKEKRPERDAELQNEAPRGRTAGYSAKTDKKSCAPCALFLFLFITFVVALPIGYYFLQHPEDFAGRSGQVSIFAADSPLKEFLKSNTLTLGMFFVWGDCNWRHNFRCRPELHPIAAVFFAAGIFAALRALRKKKGKGESATARIFPDAMVPSLLLTWLFFMSLPATLTREGLPHALRSIGMIPPVMILAAAGGFWIHAALFLWLERKKTAWPFIAKRLERIQKEFSYLFLLIPLLIPLTAYHTYFIRWSHNPHTYFAFATDLWHLGEYLDGTDPETKKIILVNLPGVEVRTIPMPAQTVMFATDTFWGTERERKNFIYIPATGEKSPTSLSAIDFGKSERVLVAILDGKDRVLIAKVKNKFPELKPQAPGDFLIFKNF